MYTTLMETNKTMTVYITLDIDPALEAARQLAEALRKYGIYLDDEWWDAFRYDEIVDDTIKPIGPEKPVEAIQSYTFS